MSAYEAPPSSLSKFARAARDRRTISADLDPEARTSFGNVFARGSRRAAASVSDFSRVGERGAIGFSQCSRSTDTLPTVRFCVTPNRSASSPNSARTDAATAASNAFCAGNGLRGGLFQRAFSVSFAFAFSFSPSTQNGCINSVSQFMRREGSLFKSPWTKSAKFFVTFGSASVPPTRSLPSKFLPSTAPIPSNPPGSSLRIISIKSEREDDTNGGTPNAHSYRTHPIAHKSLAYECTPCSPNSSGAM